MARIRSVHPGLFTDESFSSLSSDAQMFLIGLWTEADDQGVFEWKPLTLRMRLRPTKDGDVSVLLDEIAQVDCIKAFQFGGKKYGAIRNFRKYQRPKSPNAVHPMTDSVRAYVGLSPPISEIAPDEEASIPQSGEIAPQMEEGGCMMEEFSVENSPQTPKRSPKPSSEQFEIWWNVYPSGRKQAKQKCFDKFARIVKSGQATAEELIAGAKRYADAGYAGSKYVKGPLVWLNGGHWEDEDIPPPGDKLPIGGQVRQQTIQPQPHPKSAKAAFDRWRAEDEFGGNDGRNNNF